MTDMLEKVKQTIKKHQLLSAGDTVLVALSGGADSVCLLDCLLALSNTLSISVCAAHVNHGLRGEDSDGDEAFVSELCEKRGVPLFVKRCDIRAMAKKTKTGIEEAGRNARYAFFKELMEKGNIKVVATAHHADDNVETVLMRLIRGTGPMGLGGIAYKNGEIIRPFLDVTREEIENYVKLNGLAYRTDASNCDTVYTRNRVRHTLIPLIIEQFNPAFSQTFADNIRLYASCGSYIKEETRKLFEKTAQIKMPACFGFSVDALLNENEFLVSAMLHSLLYEHLCRAEISEFHVQNVLALLGENKGPVSLPGGVVAEVCDRVLYLHKNEKTEKFVHPVIIGENFLVEETGHFFTASFVDSPVKTTKNTICLDAGLLSGKTLCVRNRREGDVFYPSGMEGSKKLQDFFVDSKVPRFLRDSVPIITADDEIVWIAGFRADRRFLASSTSESVLQMTIHKEGLL